MHPLATAHIDRTLYDPPHGEEVDTTRPPLLARVRTAPPHLARLRRQGVVLTPVLLLALTGCTLNSAAPDPSAAAGPAAVTVAPAQPGRLLFRRYADANGSSGSLFTSTTDGRHERQITHAASDTTDGDPGWSRDGSRIVFARYAEAHLVFTAKADGSDLKQVTAPRPATGLTFDDQPAFSPDGRSIAYVTGGGKVKNDEIEHSDLALIRPDGKGRRLLTHFPAYGGDVEGVAWSPDGRRLVYGYVNAVDYRVALFVINANGTGTRRITDWTTGAEGAIDWSPRGDRIAFRATTDEEAGIGNFYTIHPDGSGLRQITHLVNKKISHKVSFSPDGAWLAFASSDPGGANDLYIVRVDGTGLHRVAKTALEEGGPAWGPAA